MSLKRDLDRPATSEEIAIVRWLLDNAAVGDVAEYLNQNLRDLHVVGGCGCGCISVDFEPGVWAGDDMIADAFAQYPDGVQSGLILWGKSGRIGLLEVYEMHSESNRRMPSIENLRRWEQFHQPDSSA